MPGSSGVQVRVDRLLSRQVRSGEGYGEDRRERLHAASPHPCCSGIAGRSGCALRGGMVSGDWLGGGVRRRGRCGNAAHSPGSSSATAH